MAPLNRPLLPAPSNGHARPPRASTFARGAAGAPPAIVPSSTYNSIHTISGLSWFLFKCVSKKLPSRLREELHRGVGEMGIARGGSRMSMAQLFTKDGQ